MPELTTTDEAANGQTATDRAPRATDPSSLTDLKPSDGAINLSINTAMADLASACRPAPGAKYADPRSGMPITGGLPPAQPRDDDARWHQRLVADEALLRPVVQSLTGVRGAPALYAAAVYGNRRITPELALGAFDGARQLVVQCGQVLREAMLAAGFTEADFNDRAGDWLKAAYAAEPGVTRAVRAPRATESASSPSQCSGSNLDASMPHALVPSQTTEPRVSESLAASCDAGPAPVSATS